MIFTGEDELKALQELRTASHRAVGIVAGSIVEIRLASLIKASFITNSMKRKGGETVADAMFHASGPLGDFSAKIRLAYLTGLITEEAFKDLETMREIRNRFAHRLDVGSFDHPEISSRCGNLKLVDRYISDPDDHLYPDATAIFAIEQKGARLELQNPRDRYVLAAQVFSVAFENAAPDDIGPRSPHF